jgi:GTP cyclohydrolase I
MRKKDKKIEDFFERKDDFKIQSTLVSVTSAHNTFQEAIDSSPESLISKRRKTQATSMINAAKMVLLAYNTDAEIGKLDLRTQRRVLEMVDDLVKGRREVVQFQLSHDCESIKEVFSNEVFKISKK